MKNKVPVFNYDNEYIYIPVSDQLVRMKATLAKSDDYLLRPFLPSNDLTKKYIHKLSGKNEKGVGDYFETVIAIQKSYNDWIDGKCKNRRGVTLGRVLSPTFGWIRIKIEVLINGDLSKSNISTLLTSIDIRPDGIYNFDLEMDLLFDSSSTTGRKFQREFDEKSKKFWGENCVVADVSVPVQSCHIKSVKKCKETLDIKGFIDEANSIRLQPSLHWLFDKGYFSFLDDGSIIIADKFSTHDRNKYNVHPKIQINLPEGASKYLAEHRAEFFPCLTKLVA